MDQCFCHFQGLRVKDAEARENIQRMQQNLDVLNLFRDSVAKDISREVIMSYPMTSAQNGISEWEVISKEYTYSECLGLVFYRIVLKIKGYMEADGSFELNHESLRYRPYKDCAYTDQFFGDYKSADSVYSHTHVVLFDEGITMCRLSVPVPAFGTAENPGTRIIAAQGFYRPEDPDGIPAIPEGYRLLTAADEGKVFGVDLERAVYHDPTATPVVSQDGVLVRVGNDLAFDGDPVGYRCYGMNTDFTLKVAIGATYKNRVKETYNASFGFRDFTMYFDEGDAITGIDPSNWNNWLYVKDIN